LAVLWPNAVEGPAAVLAFAFAFAFAVAFVVAFRSPQKKAVILSEV
jgi:hypothetical protein